MILSFCLGGETNFRDFDIKKLDVSLEGAVVEWRDIFDLGYL